MFPAPCDTGDVVLAHANGFSWDEALMVLAPIAVIAAILLYVNNKLRRGLGDQLLGEGEPADPEAEAPTSGANGTPADPTTSS
jgi:hypothetical protein